MNNSESRLQYLIDRYYHGAASETEKEELMSLVREGGHDALLEQYMKDNWLHVSEGEILFSQEKSSAILHSILGSAGQKKAEKTTILRLNWVRYAAAAVLVLAGLGIWYNAQKGGNKLNIFGQLTEVADVKPGGNKALLTLSDGSAIALDEVGSGFVARQGDAEISKSQEGILIYNAKNNVSSSELTINKITTPKGGQYQVQLPDGSKVWLNANSSIRFPSVFAANERNVEITGEAYFEVAKNKDKPFKVKFNQSEVLVLGTSFNIMAYPEEGASKTTLVEGSVSIKNVDQNAKLKPGQQAAVLSSGQIKTKFTPVEEAVAWKNGEFYFQDASVEEVMRQLSRWYNVEVTYKGQIPLKQFSGRISRKVNLSEITGMLQFAGVNCRMEEKEIIIEP
ncbi:FecR family protein [Dyadobacter aurulentus]|uniref:FecR family protein n=1 Tax=Dyadobacter sp. UC 10 TaxID=2605428 RepID=UPI0011F181E7|nr:FecR family protein [Dyadobacter sp. UC 10]KAA0989211.1 FecR family protein [Dyadobacter sp. UC 10]